MKVKNAMHKGVTWVEPGTPVDTLAILMREHDIGAIPIGENDRLIGMVTDRDIVCRCLAAGLDPKTTTARDVMTEGIIFCLDKQELDDAARIMEMKQVRRLPVVNGKKRMIGMLSLGDVYHRAPDHLGDEVMHGVSAHHEQERLAGNGPHADRQLPEIIMARARKSSTSAGRGRASKPRPGRGQSGRTDRWPSDYGRREQHEREDRPLDAGRMKKEPFKAIANVDERGERANVRQNTPPKGLRNKRRASPHAAYLRQRSSP